MVLNGMPHDRRRLSAIVVYLRNFLQRNMLFGGSMVRGPLGVKSAGRPFEITPGLHRLWLRLRWLR